MKIIDLISAMLAKAGNAVPNLDAELKAIVAKYPDTAPILTPLINVAELPVDVAGAATATLAEGGQILLFHFDGREHASSGF